MRQRVTAGTLILKDLKRIIEFGFSIKVLNNTSLSFVVESHNLSTKLCFHPERKITVFFLTKYVQ